MPYRERRVSSAGLTIWTRTASGQPSSILPDGCLDVIWDGDALFVAGPDTAAHVARAVPGTRFAAVRFDPGVGPVALGVPADAVRDQRVDLGSLLGRSTVDELIETLAASDLIDVEIERWAVNRLRAAGGADTAIQHVVGLLDSGGSVSEAADALGIGERQLHRRSLAAFGYGPKVLARVLRLQRALRVAAGGDDLARTAALAGYADQSHLSREVRALTGHTPSELLQRAA